ncbi:Nodule Cysteine-Rich (NCR) secreted peptide [Medicago truncatula]|uniref:Nodule Cysteine-Rich (NCR) secreted peptide n=1 Tax=Medicago truncatula TaxID=3880 RepID=G7L5G4_MEDTR|nr:Nodule Cysteine-Rich (NCR) secreted peptide [Medicago truncatula]
MGKIVKFVYFMIIFISPFVVANHAISGLLPKLPFGCCTSNLDCPRHMCTHPQQPWCIFYGNRIMYRGSRLGICKCS